MLTKRPGYTWNGPEEDEDAEPTPLTGLATDDDSDDEA